MRRTLAIAFAALAAAACFPAGALAASRLGRSEATAIVHHALWKRFAGEYTSRHGYSESCAQASATRWRCRVAWQTAKRSYSGTVTAWLVGGTERSSVSVVSRALAPKPIQSQSCDPNYTGACLDPNASDYDCAGGSGDGPKYTGTVTVVGDDHYGLDRDGDGIACED